MKKTILSIVFIELFSSFYAMASPCNDALITGKFDEAIHQGEQDSSFDGRLCTARALLALGSVKDASSYLEQAVKLSQTPYEKMLVATYQGRASKALGDTPSAILYFQRATVLAAEVGQKQAQWFNLNALGQIQLDSKSVEPALETFLKAYAFAANDNERSESDQLISSAYKAKGDMNHAIEYQLKATLLEKRSGELTEYVDAVLELADLRITNKELVAAEKNIREVMGITSEAKSDYWSARAFYVLAKLEYAKGDVAAYKQARLDARSYAEKAGDKTLQQQVEGLKE